MSQGESHDNEPRHVQSAWRAESPPSPPAPPPAPLPCATVTTPECHRVLSLASSCDSVLSPTKNPPKTRCQVNWPAGFSLLKLLAPWNVALELISSRHSRHSRDGSDGSDGSSSPGSPLLLHDTVDSKLDRAVFLVALALLVGTAPRPFRPFRAFRAFPPRRRSSASSTTPLSALPALPAHVWTFAFVSTLVPPCSGSFMSFTRFSSLSVFPLFWALDRHGDDGGAEADDDGDPPAAIEGEPKGNGRNKQSACGPRLRPRRRRNAVRSLVRALAVSVCLFASSAVQAWLAWRFIQLDWAA